MENQNISYLAYESSQARMERVNTRLWVVILVLIVALLGTNGAWIWYESQWRYVETETSIEATQEGDNNIVNGGDMLYGSESEAE